MCNRYRSSWEWRWFTGEFSDIKIPLRMADPMPNLPAEVRPTNKAMIFRFVDAAEPMAGVEGAALRWGLIPWFHKGRPGSWKMLGTNARSETVSTVAMYREAFKRRRCLIPAEAYFEWTGEKGSKVKWMFTRTDDRPFCFAGLWDRCDTEDGPIDSFTMMTTEPEDFCRTYHDRQPVILERDQWATWLDLSPDAAPLLTCEPSGLIKVELAPKEDRI